MASSVAHPPETEFAQIPGVSQMTSVSSLGAHRDHASVQPRPQPRRRRERRARSDQGRAGAACPKTFPTPPTLKKVNPTNSQILLLAATSNALPLTQVDHQVSTKLMQQISQSPGVGQVSIGGQQTPAIRIQLDPAKLVAKNLSLEEVRPVLTAAATNNPKGTIYSGARAFTTYDNDQITRTTLWNDVVVAYKNGGALRVRDIGQAVAGPQDTTQAGWADGKRAVFLVIYKLPGANVIDAVQEIYAELPRIKASMPLSLDISVVSDRTTTIRASVNDVQNTLFITIAPVVAVTFVFLRSLWATLIPSVTAPLALLGAFALMLSTTLSPCWRTSSVTSKTA